MRVPRPSPFLPLFRFRVLYWAKTKEQKWGRTGNEASNALLRIHIIGGQKSVRIAPPSLPPHHCSPVSKDFQSSISVEALLQGCHLDAQSLLHQQLLPPAMIQHKCLLPLDRVVVFQHMLHYSHASSMPSSSRMCPSVPSVLSPVSVSSLQCRPGHSYRGYNIEAFQLHHQNHTHPHTKTMHRHLGVQLYTWQYMSYRSKTNWPHRFTSFNLQNGGILPDSTYTRSIQSVSLHSLRLT